MIQGGKVLDALAGCSTIAFDKTGTLTTGALSCTSMLPLHHSSKQTSHKTTASGKLPILLMFISHILADDAAPFFKSLVYYPFNTGHQKLIERKKQCVL